MRIHCAQKRMRLEQADLLEAYLQQTGGVRQAVVHERTCCAVIHYQCAREELLQRISRFAYDAEGVAELAPLHSSRALNRTYEEKLVGRIAFKAVRSLFFPAPLRIAYTLWKSIPYLFRGVRCLLRGKLRVELLDGLSIGISMVRRDFATAGSVMFLLELGELLEEWTTLRAVCP